MKHREARSRGSGQGAGDVEARGFARKSHLDAVLLSIASLVVGGVSISQAATAGLADLPAAQHALGRHPFPAAPLPDWAYEDPLAGGGSRDTAVYDIAAHVVVLPDGTRLEAHSGLGDRVDSPRFVRERMRGPTPPALYELAYRERPFHGVAALRLKAIEGDVFGRGGLLTHTYMLRGRPESNGCVVFRDYATFLQAFREGRFKRLRVIPAVGEATVGRNAA